MTHKLKLIFILGLFSLLLTACGAKVSTETTFLKDGSGQRIIYLKIAAKDEGNIEGGFVGLEKVLEEHAPECIMVSRHEDNDTKDMIYEIKYEFSDIDDFKTKTKEVAGKDTKINWQQEKGAFEGSILYSEEMTTKDLIRWAFDALEGENISSMLIGQAYEEEESKVSYEGEVVWTGTENPSFQVNLTPKVEDVSVYTNYKEDGMVTKQINIGFSYEDYTSMNMEEGLEYLKSFSEKFKVDRNCNGYSVLLSSEEELEEFFKKASDSLVLEIEEADLDISESGKNYEFDYKYGESIFSDEVSIKEVYNLNKLLEGFVLSTDRIHNYVSVPKRDSYNTELIHHTYSLESTNAYQYIGEYDVKDTFYMYFQGGRRTELTSASVKFSIDESLRGVQTVVITLAKNGMKLTSSQVMEHYVGLGEKVQYEDDDDTATITFTKELNYGKKEKENHIVKMNTFQIYKLKYKFATEFSMEQYFEQENMNVKYTVELPAEFKVHSFSFGDEILNKKEISARKDSERWTYTAELPTENQVKIHMVFSRANMFFYGILCIIILLLVGTTLSIYFFVKGKKKKE